MQGKFSVPNLAEGSLEITKEEMGAAQRFFSSLIPGFMKDGVGILDDKIKFRRYKNILKITVEAKKLQEKYGLRARELPPKLTIPFIEAASLEEDPALQTMWTNLLANTASGRLDTNIIFISILKDLSSGEAKILQYIYEKTTNKDIQDVQHWAYVYESTMIEELNIISEDANIIRENLFRTNLIQRPNIVHPTMWSNDKQDLHKLTSYLEKEVAAIKKVDIPKLNKNVELSG